MKLPSVDLEEIKVMDPKFLFGKDVKTLPMRATTISEFRRQLGGFDKESFAAASPAPFVGRYGYPNINVGILAPPEHRENAWVFDAPRYWARESFGTPEVVGLRSSLLNSRFRSNVFSARKESRFIDVSQEVGMASKPVDIEVNLQQKPRFRLSLDEFAAPRGANAELKKIQVTSNPKVEKKVEKVVFDTDLKANEGINYLYDSGFDENFLSRLLSVGNAGVKVQRKFVPTRWSITATDDMIGKHILDEVRDFRTADYQAYFGGYLGNYYLVMMFPEVWSYELFEAYAGDGKKTYTNYTTDHELYHGRKYYAENTIGGYYTARLALLEKLRKMKRQATCLVLRFITTEYKVPLGVWVTREAARNALSQKPIAFSGKGLMLEYARKLARKHFNYNADYLLDKSVLLREMREQPKLSRFFV